MKQTNVEMHWTSEYSKHQRSTLSGHSSTHVQSNREPIATGWSRSRSVKEKRLLFFLWLCANAPTNQTRRSTEAKGTGPTQDRSPARPISRCCTSPRTQPHTHNIDHSLSRWLMKRGRRSTSGVHEHAFFVVAPSSTCDAFYRSSVCLRKKSDGLLRKFSEQVLCTSPARLWLGN
jgi:hypothetical protein